MLTPYLTIFMNSNGFSVFEIGIVLTSGVIFQQGFTFFGGLVGDKWGYRGTIIIGILVRIIGYLLYLVAGNFYMLIIASSFSGIGGALIVPSTKAIIASLEVDHRTEAFALRNTALNMGASIGPLIGAILYKFSFNFIFIIVVLTHLFLLILILKYVNKIKSDNENKNIFNDFQTVIKDKRIIYLMLVSIGFWFLYTQLTLSIPLFITNNLQSEYLIGIVFSINAILTICLQFFLIQLTAQKFSSLQIISYGMLFMSGAFIIIPLFSSSLGIYFFIFLFTIAEILVAPTIDNVASTLTPSNKLLGSYLGFVSLGWAIGGSLGNTLGGYLYNLFDKLNHISYLWLIYSLVGLSTALLFRNNFLNEKGKVMVRANKSI
jgi:MFS family permease